MDFSVVDAGSAAAHWLMSQYFAELDARFPNGFDHGNALDEAADDYNPPRGLFVVAGPVDAPRACGAVQFLDDDRGEIKRMWVAPASRGQGLASALVIFLEERIREAGRRTAVLDTKTVLPEAVALYEKHGYQRVERYNDNPYADLWFAKALEAETR